ncbi:MAG: hypothetical protein WC244_02605 [Patescibacteria group bacterium]|jgi:hypothetical protein
MNPDLLRLRELFETMRKAPPQDDGGLIENAIAIMDACLKAMEECLRLADVKAFHQQIEILFKAIQDGIYGSLATRGIIGDNVLLMKAKIESMMKGMRDN